MAITNVDKFRTGARGGVKAGRKRTYFANYRVTTDSFNDGPERILAHFENTGTLPFLGDSYAYGNDGDASSLCQSIDIDKVEGSQFLHDVTVEYAPPESSPDSKQKPDNDGNITEDPIKFADEIQMGFVARNAPVTQAINLQDIGPHFYLRAAGTIGPIINTALDVLDPPLEIDEFDLLVRITRNLEKSVDADILAVEINSLNGSDHVIDRAWHGFVATVGKHKGLITSIGSSFVFENDIKYWRTTYEVRIRNDTWNPSVLNQGSNARALSGDPDGKGGVFTAGDFQDGEPRLRRILDRDGHPLSGPVNLNSDGQPLHEGDSPIDLRYQIYLTEFDWSDIPILS